jgi:hypothetical protein
MDNLGLLLTFALAVAAVWLALGRFRMRLENSWPLILYLLMVVYSNSYNQVLNAYVLYVSVVCALLLRFEFMNERVVYFVRWVEVACLSWMAYTMFRILAAVF